MQGEIPSPVERFEGALREGLPAGEPEVSRWRPFPFPVGAWLVHGEPSRVRRLMRAHGVSPAGLLHAWVIRWPVKLKVETWGKKVLERHYGEWGDEAKRVYARQRKALADLLTVRGELSKEARLVCARFGAWCALAYRDLEQMPLSWVSWAGVGKVVGDGPGAFWLQSDNYRGEVPEGKLVYRASELGMLYREPVEVVGMALELKRAFPGARVLSVADGEVEAEGLRFESGRWVRG